MAKRNSAQRAYIRRFVPAMVLYAVALTASMWLNRNFTLEGPTLYAVSILPAVPLLAVIAIIMIYVRDEADEYLRQRTVSAMTIGTSILLAVLTVWGFLEIGAAAPHFPTYLAFPIWCGAFGIVSCFSLFRDRSTESLV